MNKKVFIIAEAGVNHNGSLSTAKKMIDMAVQAGVDAVKFQTFEAKELASTRHSNQLDMLKKLELSPEAHKTLFDYCKHRGIVFLSSPFDLKSIDLLDKLGLKTFKIPSGEITNPPYLKKIGSLKKKIIISTGMSDLKEIKEALNLLIKSGTKKKDITVLHCNTAYPTAFGDVNLSAMLTIKEKFGVDVGYSDHTLGIEIPIAAVALGATVIEKHFTLDRNMPGPDHKASLEPDELKAMVRAIRNIEESLGDGIKKPTLSELKNKPIARKSIVASRDIKKGESFNETNITAKRPGTGINPMLWNRVIGRYAKKDFKQDELIEL